MFKSLNKGISTPVAITIIILCALLVGGIIVYQYYEIPKEEEETPEAKLPEGAIPEDETADWKTYRNEEYGFEIKYPKDSTINVEVFNITKPRNYNLADSFVNHPEDWLPASDNEQLPSGFYEITVNNRTWEGYYYTGGIGAAEPITYFTRDNNLVIGVVMVDIDDFINSFEEVEKILSTFRFSE